MADIAIAITRAAANTSTGTQTFTATELGGRTPKAALFFCTYATADATQAVDAGMFIGACDGTSEWFVSANDEDAQTTTDSAAYQHTTACLYPTIVGGNAADGVAVFDSFGADTVTIDWTNAPAAAYLVTCVMFAGDDLSAAVGSVRTNIAGTVVDETSLGFEPDLVFVASDGFTNGTSLGSLRASYGFGLNNGAETQISQYHISTNGVGTSSTIGETTAQTVGGDGNSKVNIQDFDSSGFSMVPRRVTRTVDNNYLALKLGGRAMWGGAITPPSVTGNSSYVTNFKPAFVFIATSLLQGEEVGIAESADQQGPFGFSVFTADEGYTNAVSIQDAVGTSVCKSVSEGGTGGTQKVISLDEGDATAAYDATLVSFDANGFTLNYSAVETTSRHVWWGFAIGDGIVDGVSGNMRGGMQ